jgi:hypothetical protein
LAKFKPGREGFAVKKKRFAVEQVVAILKQAEPEGYHRGADPAGGHLRTALGAEDPLTCLQLELDLPDDDLGGIMVGPFRFRTRYARRDIAFFCARTGPIKAVMFLAMP